MKDYLFLIAIVWPGKLPLSALLLPHESVAWRVVLQTWVMSICHNPKQRSSYLYLLFVKTKFFAFEIGK